jgi:acyl phosphate:glycerol-3-phosphate acyltransferase
MAIAAIVGYLLGSIPTALIVGRWRGVDPRQRGDGNPGWWNMRGLVGDRVALFVLAGDTLKGVLAAVAGGMLWGPWWTAYVAVIFAMIGHAYPCFGDFRGGRSVLTFVGGMFVIEPSAALLSLAAGVVFALAMRHVVYGARLAVLAFPLVQALSAPRGHVFATLGLMAFIGLRFVLAPAPPGPQSSRHGWRVPHPWMQPNS